MPGINLQVKQIISEKLKIKTVKIKDESSFTSDLGANSVDILDVVLQIERKYTITIPDEEIEKFDTVRSLINYLDQRFK